MPRADERCGSAPFCDQPPVAGRRFCAEHQAILDRAKANFAFRYKAKSIAAPNKPTPQSPEQRQRRILAALREKGELSLGALAFAVGAEAKGNTYKRDRRALMDAGLVKVRRDGKRLLYRLA